MIEAGRYDIEHRYQMLTGGPEVTGMSWNGVLVEDSDGSMCELQGVVGLRNDLEDSCNLWSLPEDSVLVFRTAALRKFEQSLEQGEGPHKEPDSLSESERKNLLKMVYGMAIAAYKYKPGPDRNTATAEKKDRLPTISQTLGWKWTWTRYENTSRKPSSNSATLAGSPIDPRSLTDSVKS